MEELLCSTWQIAWPQPEPMDQDNNDKKPNLTFQKDHNNPPVSANTNISVSDRVKHDDHDTTQPIPIIH